MHHGDGAVVDVEQDAVVAFGLGFAEDDGGVGDLELHAGVVDALAVELLQVLAVPVDDFGGELEHFEGGVGPAVGEGLLEGEAEAEAADEHAAGLVFGKGFAAELAEELFGGGGLGVHELLAAEVDGVGSVLLVEGEDASGGGMGFGEFVAWLQVFWFRVLGSGR